MSAFPLTLIFEYPRQACRQSKITTVALIPECQTDSPHDLQLTNRVVKIARIIEKLWLGE